MRNKDLIEFYSKPMNPNEISKIDDKKIKEIKLKYCSLQHKAFLDEQKYSDKELMKYSDYLIEQEKIEIEKYLVNKDCDNNARMDI